MNKSDLGRAVDASKDEMVQFLVDLCSVPAVNPAFGGQGEYRRVQWLKDYLSRNGLHSEVLEVPDSSVAEGKRLNLLVRLPGSGESGTLWLIGHLDTVTVGDRQDWRTDPLHPVVLEDRVIGRGVEDNGQGVAGMAFTAILMKRLGLTPRKNLSLLFVSDEETGSAKGLQYLVQQELFKDGDEALVPDSGSPDGSFIEVAEKSILWCKYTVTGKESHASMPGQGINAGWVGSLFAVDLIKTMRKKFLDRDNLFDPPYSSFELTQKFNNVGSPNVIPGKDVFVTDFRVLPRWDLQDVIDTIDRLVTKYEYKYKVRISYEMPQRVKAPEPTSPDAPLVKKLSEALKERSIMARVGGVGGGTCAAILREVGVPAVAWSTIEDKAHQPNEYALIKNLLADTRTFLAVALA
jgi:succinyl-diaminopimelate desuccinylase